MAFSKLEKAMAAIIGIQLAPGGAELSRKVVGKVLMGVARGIAPATIPAASALGPIAPVAIGAGLGYAALQTDPGQQLLAAAEERGRQDRLRLERYVQDTLALAPIRRKKRMSKFNQAVKKGMSIIKASPSYGKKGTITNTKKVFGMVSKVVSKVQHGKPKPKRGNIAIKKVFSAAAKLVSPHLKKYKLPKRKRAAKKKKDYRDYDPQG